MPTEAPTTTPTRTAPAPGERPLVDPDTIRQPGEICPQQKREQGFEAF